MRIEINRAELAAAAAWAARGLPDHPAVPVLAGMRVTVDAGRLTLAAFDFETAARSYVTGDNAAAGSVLVRGHDLAAAIKSLPAGARRTVHLTGGPADLCLACDGATATLPVLDGEDYPELPYLPPAAGTVAGDAFARSAARVAAAAGTDDTQPALTCVLLETGAGEVTLAATDRYRLAVDPVPWTPAVLDADPVRLLVPAAILAQYGKVTGGGKVTVHLAAEAEGAGYGEHGGWAGFTDGARELIVRCMAAEFPKYRALQRADSPILAEVDAPAMTAAITRAGKLSGKRDAARLVFASDGKVTVQGYRDGAVTSSETVPCELAGPAVTVGVNPKSAAAAFKGYAGRVLLGIAGMKPVAFTSTDGDPFTTLVMPVNLAG